MNAGFSLFSEGTCVLGWGEMDFMRASLGTRDRKEKLGSGVQERYRAVLYSIRYKSTKRLVYKVHSRKYLPRSARKNAVMRHS